MSSYVLSVEPVDGATFQWPFHLGTDLKLAKQIAAEKFHWRNDEALRGHPFDAWQRPNQTRTVALKWNGKIVDVYDGQWSSEYDPNWE